MTQKFLRSASARAGMPGRSGWRQEKESRRTRREAGRASATEPTPGRSSVSAPAVPTVKRKCGSACSPAGGTCPAPAAAPVRPGRVDTLLELPGELEREAAAAAAQLLGIGVVGATA